MDYNIRTYLKEDEIAQEIATVDGDIRQVIVRQVLNLSDAGFREALINLGWTPPHNKGEQSNVRA